MIHVKHLKEVWVTKKVKLNNVHVYSGSGATGTGKTGASGGGPSINQHDCYQVYREKVGYSEYKSQSFSIAGYLSVYEDESCMKEIVIKMDNIENVEFITVPVEEVIPESKNEKYPTVMDDVLIRDIVSFGRKYRVINDYTRTLENLSFIDDFNKILKDAETRWHKEHKEG